MWYGIPYSPWFTSMTEWALWTRACLAASRSHAFMKSDDSLVQQGWPFHEATDMCGRSQWLNGTPLSDCQSSACHSVVCHHAANSTRGRSCKLTFHGSCAVVWTSSRKLLWNIWILKVGTGFKVEWICFQTTCKDSSYRQNDSHGQQLNHLPLGEASRSDINSAPLQGSSEGSERCKIRTWAFPTLISPAVA